MFLKALNIIVVAVIIIFPIIYMNLFLKWNPEENNQKEKELE